MIFSNYIQSEKMKYFRFSDKKISKQKDFLNKITILNQNTGEVRNLDYDFRYNQKNTALWYNFVSTYLQNQAKNEDKIAIFLTLTLDSDYHLFKKSKFNNSYYLNKKYNSENTINLGYRKLNETFRSIIKNFRIENDKYISLQYFKVIEPHKDFTPHLHALIYISKENLLKLDKHIRNQINLLGLGKQYKIEVLRNVNAGSSYILKYIKKTLFNDNISELMVIDGWKRYNRIRLVSHSQIPVPRYLFDKVSKNISLDFGMENYDIIQNLLDNVNFTINYYEFDYPAIPYKQKKNDIKEKKYNVNIDIEVKEIKLFKYKDIKIGNLYDYYTLIDNLYDEGFDFYSMTLYRYNDFDYLGDLYYLANDFDFVAYYKNIDIDEFLDLFQNYISEHCYETKKVYKIKKYIIIEDEEIIYNKDDFILI